MNKLNLGLFGPKYLVILLALSATAGVSPAAMVTAGATGTWHTVDAGFSGISIGDSLTIAASYDDSQLQQYCYQDTDGGGQICPPSQDFFEGPGVFTATLAGLQVTAGDARVDYVNGDLWRLSFPAPELAALLSQTYGRPAEARIVLFVGDRGRHNITATGYVSPPGVTGVPTLFPATASVTSLQMPPFFASSVPEPSSATLAVLGIGAFLSLRKLRKTPWRTA